MKDTDVVTPAPNRSIICHHKTKVRTQQNHVQRSIISLLYYFNIRTRFRLNLFPDACSCPWYLTYWLNTNLYSWFIYIIIMKFAKQQNPITVTNNNKSKSILNSNSTQLKLQICLLCMQMEESNELLIRKYLNYSNLREAGFKLWCKRTGTPPYTTGLTHYWGKMLTLTIRLNHT